MSDVSVLSHEYQTASELTRSINDALITLKRVTLQLPGSSDIASDTLRAGADHLAQIVETLISLLDPAAEACVTGAVPSRIPRSLVGRLQRDRRGDLPYYVDDLRHLASCLRTKSLQLTDPQLALLDQLAAAAEGEAAGVFRRLMRT